jgi:hypothetical protein
MVDLLIDGLRVRARDPQLAAKRKRNLSRRRS